ncbi:MAG: hypothetical protein DLM69_11860 [Candidatus Chloroheliales bacterium]|nr:MAG: hypothetical protein DLM69_11860 [Chloroflexota bacterium]
MANDFALIHIYVGDDVSAPHRVAAALTDHLAAAGYTPVAEASLNPYDPRLNLVEQRSRSFYISAAAHGWVSVADEDIFRLDEPSAEALLAHLSAIGPTILLWGIDQFVWGYTCAADGRILDRYTEDYIELDAYNPTFLHDPDLSMEQQAPRYAGRADALASFFALTAPNPGPPLKWGRENESHAEHYIEGYRSYYRRTADNELTYMDELIGGAGQIYADAWAKELAADLSISQPDITYNALVQAEAEGGLPAGWQAASYRRPSSHQPNYSVALTIYCQRPLSGQVIVWLLTSVTDSLPNVGKKGWTEIEMAGTYYPNADAAIAQLETEGLAEGEHLAARYYPGCNLVVQRRGGDLLLDVVFLEYPSIIDDRYTPEVLERAVEVSMLQKFVFSDELGSLAEGLFKTARADYGYISVAGGGVGGDGGGRANGPGAMLADTLAKPLAQLSSRVAVKEAASWRQRWGQLDHNIRGVYWANLLSTVQSEQIATLATQPDGFVVDDAGTGVAYIQLPCTLAEYADGKAEADIERLRDVLLPLLEL